MGPAGEKGCRSTRVVGAHDSGGWPGGRASGGWLADPFGVGLARGRDCRLIGMGQAGRGRDTWGVG